MRLRMKRAVGLAILPAAVVLLIGLLIGTPRAGAAEFDIDLSSEVGAEHTGETDIFTETAADASLSWILSPDSDVELAGGYSYRYDEGAPESEGEFIPALDRARYFARVPISDAGEAGDGTVAELTAGRFGLRDTTGMVVDTPADGVSVGIVAPVVTFRVQSAYTGLLFRDSTDIRLTTGDLLDDDNLFGPAHLLGRVEIAFPELLGRQSIIVDAVGHLDLPELPSSELDSTDEADGLYSSLTLTGPLSRRVFYTVYGIGRASRYFADSDDNEETYSTLAAAAGASLRAFAPELGKSRAELQLGWAGGERGFSRTDLSSAESGTAGHFAPITAPSLVRFTPVLLSNVAFAKLDYSVQPVDIGAGPREGLRTAVSVAAVYRPVEGAGTVSELSPTADVGYVGTEAGTTIEIRPLSDLRFALEGDIFWPSSLLRNAGAVDDTTPHGRVTARIQLSM